MEPTGVLASWLAGWLGCRIALTDGRNETWGGGWQVSEPPDRGWPLHVPAPRMVPPSSSTVYHKVLVVLTRTHSLENCSSNVHRTLNAPASAYSFRSLSLHIQPHLLIWPSSSLRWTDQPATPTRCHLHAYAHSFSLSLPPRLSVGPNVVRGSGFDVPCQLRSLMTTRTVG